MSLQLTEKTNSSSEAEAAALFFLLLRSGMQPKKKKTKVGMTFPKGTKDWDVNILDNFLRTPTIERITTTRVDDEHGDPDWWDPVAME